MKPLLLLAALAAVAASPAHAKPAWQSIFDGRTLDGWTPKITGHALGEDPLHTFTVKHGAIRVSYANYTGFGGQFGHLFWRAPVSAFRVRFEYRFYGEALPGVERWQYSNSGLMFDGQPPETMTRDQKFPVSLEFQLLGAARPEPQPSGNLCTPGTNIYMAGALVTRHCTLATGPVRPNGRWIKAEVEVRRDGTITHFIAGKSVLTYSRPELDPSDADARPLIARAGGRLEIHGGYLSLQSEGHPVEFRRIELLRLD